MRLKDNLFMCLIIPISKMIFPYSLKRENGTPSQDHAQH